MSTQRIHEDVEAHYSGLERLQDTTEKPSGPVATFRDGTKREIKSKQRMKMNSAAIARNLEAWVS